MAVDKIANKKKKPSKYDDKLAVKATFGQLINISVKGKKAMSANAIAQAPKKD